MPDVLVTGATGTVGTALVALLTARGASVRAMSRRPRPDTLPSGAEPFAGDLGDPQAVTEALRGVRRVFLLTAGPDGPRHDDVLATAAAAAGVEHLVKLSVLGLTEGADDPITEWHRAGEAAITRAGLPASFLRPGAFMSNSLTWAGSIAATSTVFAPVGDLPVASIDPLDIAAVAAQLLIGPMPADRVYPLTGPEAISPRQQSQILGELLGRPVSFAEIGPEDTKK